MSNTRRQQWGYDETFRRYITVRRTNVTSFGNYWLVVCLNGVCLSQEALQMMMGHYPGGASIRQAFHYGQCLNDPGRCCAGFPCVSPPLSPPRATVAAASPPLSPSLHPRSRIETLDYCFHSFNLTFDRWCLRKVRFWPRKKQAFVRVNSPRPLQSKSSSLAGAGELLRRRWHGKLQGEREHEHCNQPDIVLHCTFGCHGNFASLCL